MLKIKNKSKKARKTGAGTEVYAFGRGRIHFIEKGTAFGSEQAGYRPAIIDYKEETSYAHPRPDRFRAEPVYRAV